jgi:hypothetical protein
VHIGRTQHCLHSFFFKQATCSDVALATFVVSCCFGAYIYHLLKLECVIDYFCLEERGQLFCQFIKGET